MPRVTIKSLQARLASQISVVDMQRIELAESRKQIQRQDADNQLIVNEISRLNREVNWLKDLVRTLSTKIRDA